MNNWPECKKLNLSADTCMIHIYIYMDIYGYMYTFLYIYIYISCVSYMFNYLIIPIHTYIHIHIYIYIYIYIIYTYIYIYIFLTCVFDKYIYIYIQILLIITCINWPILTIRGAKAARIRKAAHTPRLQQLPRFARPVWRRRPPGARASKPQQGDIITNSCRSSGTNSWVSVV